MTKYYAEELEERLHDMTQPFPLPWRVYKEVIIAKVWVADCQSEHIARILVEALIEDDNRIESEEENSAE